MNERAGSPDGSYARSRVLAGWAALAWCALYGWFTVVRATDVPVLSFMQLAVHEVGHRLFAPFGEYPMLVMGSGSEILAPLLLAVALTLWPAKRNLVAAGAVLAVASAACQHTAMYMADAPRGEMMLIGSSESDWLRIFDGYWDTLYKADIYAGRMRAAGIALWFAAMGLVAAGIVVERRRAATLEPAARPAVRAAPLAPVQPVDDEQMWR